jgi:hypothetical protein
MREAVRRPPFRGARSPDRRRRRRPRQRDGDQCPAPMHGCPPARRSRQDAARSAEPPQARRRTPGSGTGRTAVTPIMPANTATPSAWRTSAPAPVASISGTTAAVKVIEVMMIGRRRRRQASSAASTMPGPALQFAGELHDQDGVLAGQPHEQHQAHLHEQVVVAAAAARPRAGRTACTWARSG